ncbi:MAG: helix-turn-helix domain-containing protein [Clostridiales bacterium]|nr:helix-turn-helix domain-containing protein [Clostridiales bacterium]
MSELKELRIEKKMTQQEVSEKIGISLRSYISYENDEAKAKTLKYRFILDELRKMNVIDEEHGILSIDQIKDTCTEIMADYDIDFCYLFGSYAKGKAKENSDVDLLISGNVTGLKFFGLVERLRQGLHKKTEVLNVCELVNNEQLIIEVLRDGIKICG